MLARQLIPHLPAKFRTYWEPFLGGGSLFFLLQPERAVLNDACVPLISTYKAVRDNPIAVLARLIGKVVSREAFEQLKSTRPTDAFEAAARFIYLNKTAWNGLYRVNSKGDFNVPYGRPKSSNIVDPELLLACSAALNRKSVRLAHGDFAASLNNVEKGDLVFLDPPYVTTHNSNGFIDYNERLFTWADQQRLANIACGLRDLGAAVIVTNASHGPVAELYPGFARYDLHRMSTLASEKSRRGPTLEAVFVGNG